MNKTKIEWCDYTWNPVTGCLHGCKYCYARGQANRFAGFEPRCGGEYIPEGEGTYPKSIYNSTHGQKLHIFGRQPMKRTKNGDWQKATYPYNFDPTFHRYRLGELMRKKKPQTIFVGSMCDLFGDWIPDEWIQEVFKVCEVTPQHRYLFLTKNPHAYSDYKVPANKNFWYGQTNDGYQMLTDYREDGINAFLSIEPLLKEINTAMLHWFNWVIIGAETGKRKDKVIPEREWIENIVKSCGRLNIPVFMKNSLADVWGEPPIQEYPWDFERTETE